MAGDEQKVQVTWTGSKKGNRAGRLEVDGISLTRDQTVSMTEDQYQRLSGSFPDHKFSVEDGTSSNEASGEPEGEVDEKDSSSEEAGEKDSSSEEDGEKGASAKDDDEPKTTSAGQATRRRGTHR